MPILLASCFVSKAGPDISHGGDSATVVIQLGNQYHQSTIVDSVYLIFDRFDLSGAGVVRQIFYPVNNTVEIKVPKGKYYVDIFCLGNYNYKHFDIIVQANGKKRNKLHLRLDGPSLYTPGFVSIPAEHIN